MHQQPQNTPAREGNHSGSTRLSAGWAGMGLRALIVVLLAVLLFGGGCTRELSGGSTGEAHRSDTDGDGVPDTMDKYPDRVGPASNKDRPLDTDGDGVPDTMDKCPGSPAGVRVDANGCPLDSDGDGVSDAVDPDPDKRNDQSPAFPWPPPTPSARRQVDDRYFAARDLRGMDAVLSRALHASGYADKAYFTAPHGFVLVTQLEQINDQGAPVGDRWSIQPASYAGLSFLDYLKALFISKPGHFRIIAFAVTNAPFTTAAPAPNRDTAMAWLDKGLTALPPALGPVSSQGFRCEALIYEFVKTPSSDATMVKPSGISGDAHLNGAHLLANLNKYAAIH